MIENAESILVVILSGFLAIFLILAIALIIKCIQVINYIQRIAVKAEQIVDKAESIGEFFHRTSGPLAVGRFITNMAETVFNHDKARRKK